MQTALHTLMRGAFSCKPIKADLRASTVTFEWPANMLVQRAAYVVIPLAEAQQAWKEDKHLVVLSRSEGKPYVRYQSDDLHFEVIRGGTEFNLYFERAHDRSRYAKPGTWYGSENITDTKGKRWTRTLGRMVVDNFGDLVSLETGDQP